MALYLFLEVDGGTQLGLRDWPRKVFDTRGGRIGRAPDCDWVLSNGYISRHYATVAYADGVFYIECLGANGFALNDPAAWVRRHTRHALKHGDWRTALIEPGRGPLVRPAGSESWAGY